MSAQIKLDDSEPGVVKLSGELTYVTAAKLFDEAYRLFAQGGGVTIDLAGLSRVDSAGLALLLEWMRVARRRDAKVTLCNYPQQMVSIIKVSGLQELMPIE